VAPELFRIEGENLVFEESVPAALREKARTAAKVCPQLAITVTDD
jgi:ferredoxin